MSETVSLKELATKVKLSATYGALLDYEKQSEWQQSANGYRCTLRYKGRSYTFDFWQGTGITHDPEVEGVLYCLLSDAQGGEQDFEEFCSEFGYDADSRKAESIWKACQKTIAAMKRLLGDDYETFLYADRN